MNPSEHPASGRGFRLLSVFVVLWLVVSLACNMPSLPGIYQPTADSTQQATQVISPTARPQPTPVGPLPPALVESTPVPQTEIGLRQPLILYFNQPMNKSSVESALSSQPAVPVSFKWLDDATLTFTPSQPLPKDTDLVVSVSTDARAANGLGLTSPIQLDYRTAAGFQAVERLPLPGAVDVDPTSAIVVTFDRPVVALGGDASKQPQAFSFDPAVNGHGSWLNTSTYIFYADPGLLGGTKYSVKLNRDLAGLDGAGWKADALPDWSFSTARPAVVSITPGGTKALFLDSEFTVKFNQPMDTASVAKNFSFVGPQGAVKGKISWNANHSEMTFKPDALLPRGSNFTLSIAVQTASQGGSQLVAAQGSNYMTVRDLVAFAYQPTQDQTIQLNDTQGSISISLNSPVDYSPGLRKLISFDPVVPDYSVSSGNDGMTLYIFGNFDGRTNYTMTISDQLKDRWGSSLKEPWLLRFKTSAPATALAYNIAQSWNGIGYLLPTDSSIPARATNVKNVTVGYAAISLADFAKADAIAGPDRQAKFKGPKLTSFDRSFDLPVDKNVPVDLPLTSGGKGLEPGLYYYVVNAPQVVKPAQPPSPLLMVVSRINLVLKVSTTQLVAWAVDLEKNTPLAGAAITIYNANNGVLSEAGTIKTNEQGIATLDFTSHQDLYSLMYAVIGKPGDDNFSLAMSNWNQGVNASEFGIPAGFNDDTQQIYLYTDRPIYRPGQTVNFRAVVRKVNNGRYSIPALTHLDVNVLGAYSPETSSQSNIAKIPLDLTAFGTGTASFTLPDTAAPGYYNLDVGGAINASLGFTVAEYRKPEIELSAAFDKSESRIGSDLTAKVQAQYYFGAPAGNLALNWNLYGYMNTFIMPGNYQTGLFDSGAFLPLWMQTSGLLGSFLTSGSGITGPDGSLMITIPASSLVDKFDPQQLQNLTLEVTPQDQNEFPVSIRTETVMHPADFYVGIQPESWSGQANTEMGFLVQTADWKKAPSADRELQAVFSRVTWNQNDAWQIGSNEPYYLLEYTQAGKSDFRTDAKGQARLVFTPPAAGTYMLDINGEGAHTQALVWVGGEGSAPWPNLPNQSLHLTADADSYNPGQSARLFIPNPFGQKALALITVERSKVMRQQVVEITGSSLEYSLALGEEDAPNVYASVMLLGQTDKGQPDFRVGYLNLKVNPTALKLQVDLTSQPEKTGPGSDVKFSIRVKDAKGKPVQGEFSLAVVDKALLALADPNSSDIFTEYYADQPLGVANSLSLSVYSQRMVLFTPGRGGGGGGGSQVSLSTRSKFLDSAYWNGKIVTDASGAADVNVTLPDNLTTWVVTLRGLTKDSLVGEAVKEIVTSLDLLVRPFTPRFLVVGDHIQLSATVQNNTANSLSVDVSLQGSGIDFDDPKLANQKIDVSANGRKSASWWVKVQDVDKADLVFSAKAGNLSDSARPESGSLPVAHYSSPQTFGTSGILADSGDRLEVFSIPHSFTPTGGEFRLEMAPSLASVVLDGLKAIETFSGDFNEYVFSQLLPNLETYRTIQAFGLDATNLREQLQSEIQNGMAKVIAAQNNDGGWGWSIGRASDSLVSAYALYTLARAGVAGIPVDPQMLKNAQDYLTGKLVAVQQSTPGWQLDLMAFQEYALQVSGRTIADGGGLYPVRDRLSTWARAMLAMTLQSQKAGDERVRSLLSDLGTRAERSASGAAWESGPAGEINNVSTNLTSAVVLLALARLDPASPLVADAVRQLMAHRQASGRWSSSYETAWVLLALTETLQATGDLQANFAFSASLNGTQLAKGQAGAAGSLNGVEVRVPLRDLRPDQPNELRLSRDLGTGRMYYRAFLQVDRPVDNAPALQNGISISRQYTLPGQDCQKKDCPGLDSISLGNGNPTVLVQVSVTVPRQMYYVVVEDFIPAGSEVANLVLKTSQQGDPTQPDFKPGYDPANPFLDGWNSWFFTQPQVYDDHIRWVGTNLQPGTYVLTYRLSILQAGEYRVLPAHAYQNYFPDVQGTSSGFIFKVNP